jgi:hypothetical protein
LARPGLSAAMPVKQDGAVKQVLSVRESSASNRWC